ncbi:MAG: hypothetical protein JO301_07120 [Chitinophagaceae bacterium]|nr:hypothetical protein [Chitinophagaceae bacterium]
MFSFRRKYQLDDLTAIVNTTKTDRASVQIAVIDDKTFPLLEDLRRHQYNITFFHDIERLSSLTDFDIIVTDIRGVGKHLGSNLEGAHLIEEVKKLFPNKYLVAYSASRFDATMNIYFSMCDRQMKKDADISEWVTLLDRAIQHLHDPLFQWEKTRQLLLSKKFSSAYISKLEKAYAKTIIKRNNKYLQRELEANTAWSEKPIAKVAVESITTFAAKFIAEIISAG